VKPEKQIKRRLEEGETMRLSPKGRRQQHRASRRQKRVELDGYYGGYIVRRAYHDPEDEEDYDGRI